MTNVQPFTKDAETTSLGGWRVAPDQIGGLSDCSLIIATYKRPDEVRQLIVALAHMPDVPAEVLVIDGFPGDKTEETLAALLRDVRLPFELVYVRSPKGLTRQRNVGVDISTKAFLFFLDDDALPLEGYFAELRKVLAEDPQETIGAAGACIVNEINKAIPRRWRMRRALRIVPRSEPYIYNDVGTSTPTGLMKPFSGVRDVDIFAGGACVIRRSVLQTTRFSGFFYGYSWGEDVEMSLRIRRNWRIQNCGDARMIHFGVKSQGGRPDFYARARMEVRNRYFIWRRYSARAILLNKMRFVLDLMFIFMMDLAWFAARPWKSEHLSHAFGLLSGAASCLISAPQWDENAPSTRYRLAGAENLVGEEQCQSQTS